MLLNYFYFLMVAKDLAQGYHQVRLREADWWKTSFRSQLGQFGWKFMPFGLQGSSSVLVRAMNDAMTRGLHGPASDRAPTPPAARPGVQGADGPLHWSVVLYMDDLFCYSPSQRNISATSGRSSPSPSCGRRSSTSGMSCPSWQWHRAGYHWSPVRTLPVAPLCHRLVV